MSDKGTEMDYEYSLNIGDKMRMSVALLRELYDMPDHESVVIVFKGSRFDDDGIKVALFGKVDG